MDDEKKTETYEDIGNREGVQRKAGAPPDCALCVQSSQKSIISHKKA